jgi:hypothetical protein
LNDFRNKPTISPVRLPHTDDLSIAPNQEVALQGQNRPNFQVLQLLDADGEAAPPETEFQPNGWRQRRSLR